MFIFSFRFICKLHAPPQSCTARAEGLKSRNLKAFSTTHTELTLIAAAANIGLRLSPAHTNAPAARGIHSRL